MLRGWFAVALCALVLDAAPIINNHPLDALAKADALIVGRVVSVEKGAEVFPPQGRTWRHPVYEHVAQVEVLRLHAVGRELREQLDARGLLRVGYRAENPLNQGGVFAGPLWPAIRVGEVCVFGVRHGPEGFRLWFEEGLEAVPPALETLLHELPAADGVSFLERELVNGLASGDAAMAFKAARYADAAFFFASLNSVENRRPALDRRLAEMLAGDSSRTRIAVAALVAAQGSARPSVAGLRDGRAPEGRILRTYQWLLIRALDLLPEENADSMIIETLLDNPAAFHWSTVVNEYAHHPALDAPLAVAIEQRKPGILPLLEALVRAGRTDLTPNALTVLREQLASPDLRPGDWHCAGHLVLNHGSDEDFALFLGLVLRAQTQDLDLYKSLWNAGAYDEAAPRDRMLRFLAIFLYDNREAFGRVRYSEAAAHRLAAISGDRFGLDSNRSLAELPPADRDEAVRRARAWLQDQITR